MKRLSLVFTGPRQVALQREPLTPLAAGQVLVATRYSAISPGTETLIYRGQFPADLALDDTLDALPGAFAYPFKYGYAAVGQVVEVGPQVEQAWRDRWVFAFNPHESHFMAPLETLLPLPANVDPLSAIFLPNMESALNLVMDGRPLIGERVAVFGQGVLGLLTTMLLQRFPLERLVTLDRYTRRRHLSLVLGADASLDPDNGEVMATLVAALGSDADLIFELSGHPHGLDMALAVCGFHSRVVVGSWYGTRRASLDLSGRFHRNRVRLLSSQVSTIAPELQGRWTKARRYRLAWASLAEADPGGLITHTIPFSEAARAYRLLDRRPQDCVQVVLQYEPA